VDIEVTIPPLRLLAPTNPIRGLDPYVGRGITKQG
jgi:hypothetical protein